MTPRTQLSGSLVALVTPMSASGAVDYGALRALVDWHAAEGTDGLVAVGTTGESATLGVNEHLEVIARVREYAAGRLPVIAGTGANATEEAVTLSREARGLGVDACLVVTPYYNKPSQEGLYRHYAHLADSVEVPLILYNVPGRTGCDLLPATVARLLDRPNIVAIKEALGSQQRIGELLALDPGFVVFSGDDATARESMLLGARGDVSVTANVVPGPMHRMCAAAIAGDADLAAELDRPLAGLHQELFVEPNPVPVKWALQRMGRIPEGIRLPLVALNAQYHSVVEQALIRAGVSL